MPIRETSGKTAVIIGSAAKAKYFDTTDYENPDIEIWGINAIRLEWVQRWDRMFNIHKEELLKKYGWPLWKEYEWCAEHPGVKFYTAGKWNDGRMKRAIVFPREAIVAKFPRGDYHCNSCDWLIAFALYSGFTEVRLHGWTLARDGMMEQMSARACAEYWSGYAEGKGMKVTLASDSDLFTAYHLVRSNRVYGYDDCPAYEDRVTGNDPPYRYDQW